MSPAKQSQGSEFDVGVGFGPTFIQAPFTYIRKEGCISLTKVKESNGGILKEDGRREECRTRKEYEREKKGILQKTALIIP